jgi:SAM-dependent methyltransferase
MTIDIRQGESSGRRAEALYDAAYARCYRERDDALLQVASYAALIAWLGEVCGRFARPIDVLDLGCGTGRYFWGLRGVASLVGLDASEAMLAEARQPVRQDQLAGVPTTLVRGDLVTHEFEEKQFDLVYSIGVLAEHVALDASLVARVARWLRPGGRFAFTTVHPESLSVPRTRGRRWAAATLPWLPGAAGRRLHHRLMAGGMYGDERWVRDRLANAFEIEALERFESDVHLHGRCVARRSAA